MQTNNQTSLIRKTLYGIMLLGVFLSAFSAGNLSSVRAQVETPQTPTPTSEPPACFTLDAVVVAGEGTLTATTLQNCDGGYLEGTEVEIIAQPADGYVLQNWQGSDNDLSVDSTIVVTIMSNRAVEAIFEQEIPQEATPETLVTDPLTSLAVCPPSIGFGETIQCSIDSAGETDTYTFPAVKGDKVLVRMSKSAGTLLPKIRVLSIDGVTQLCETGYNTVTAEIASCSLPSTGTYTILASDYYETNTGDYYLYLQHLNNPGGAVPIAFGQTLPGSIFTPAEMDSYTFPAVEGDKVLVRMSKSAGTLLPRIRVFSPDGTQLCETGYNTVTAEIASCPLPITGTYTILAFDYYGTNTGDYYLYLQRLNNPGGAVPIAFGQTLPGSILTPAEMDTYTFPAVAGDKVLVRMSKSAGTLLPRIRVFSPNGTQLCETGYNTVTAEIASCSLPDTGTYTILAFDYYGTNTGDYYLYLQRLNNPGGAVPIAFGQTLPGSILTPAEMDTYTFPAVAGDKVLVRMSKSAGTLLPRIRVFSPNGTQLCETGYNTVTAEIASCSLPITGTYTILAFDYYGTNTGDYYLYLQRLNNPGGAVPIAFGQTLSGSILTPAEMDTYTFTAVAGDKVLVRMSKSAGTLLPRIRVFSPNGTQLCETGYNTVTAEIASCPLPITGTYTILAFDYYGTNTGEYYLYLQRLNNPGSPVPITSGQTLSGSILTPAEMDTYTFTANSGNKVLVWMSKSAGTLLPRIRVFSPNGTQLCETGYNTVTAKISCSLPNTGTYTILAFDYYGTNTGNYSLCFVNAGVTCTSIFRSVGTQDGWVLKSAENSKKGSTLDKTAATFRLGDDKLKKQYRGILSFSTGTSLPDNAVITKVMLKIRQHSITGGGNPVTAFQGFMVDIKKGPFGAANLQASDFQTAASKSYGSFMTTPGGGWYNINLTNGQGYVNKLSALSGLTQIRLRFKLDDNNNAVANYLNIYSGNASAASRPQLIIQYRIP